MAAKVISKLSIILGINAGEVRQGTTQAASAVRKLSTDVSSAGSSIGDFNANQATATLGLDRMTAGLSSAVLQFAAFAGGAAAAAFSVQGLISSFGRIDEVAKLADQLGLSIGELQGFRLGAQLAGVELSTLERGLQRLARNLGEVDNKEFNEALQSLGIEAEKIRSLSPADALAEIAEAIKGIEDPTQRAAAAYAVFGRSGQDLLNFLAAGRDGVADMIAEAERLGLAMDRDMAARVEQANDAITVMSTSVQAFTDTLAVQLAPTVQMVAEALTALTLNIGSVDASTVRTVLQVTAFVASIGLIVKIVPSVIAAIRTVIITLRALAIAGTISQAATGNLVGVLAAVAVGGAAAIGVGLAFDSLTKSTEGAATAAKAAEKTFGDAKFLPPENKVDEAAEAMKRLQKETEEWQRIGERLTSRFRTPFEEAQDSIEEATEALRRGVISWETYQRAVDAAVDSLDREQQVASARQVVTTGAVTRRSAEGFGLGERARLQAEQIRESQAKQAKRDDERNKLLAAVNAKLDSLNENTRNQVVVRENRI